ANLRSAYNRIMGLDNHQGYSYLAGIYGIPHYKSKHHEAYTGARHNFRLFLPWSRAYLFRFEQYLQKAKKDPSITIPWWDWSSDVSRKEGIPKAFSDETINEGPNPLFKFRVGLPDDVNLDTFAQTGCPKSREFDTHREPGLPAQLPTPNDLKGIIK